MILTLRLLTVPSFLKFPWCSTAIGEPTSRRVVRMVLLLFYDGSTIEVPSCEDVAHEAGGLVCVDHVGASVATFTHEEILGYTLDPRVISKVYEDNEATSQAPRRSNIGVADSFRRI